MKRHINIDPFGALDDFTPMCASCKTIRNDEGYWVKFVGASPLANREVEFAYLICAKCARKLKPARCGQTR